MTPKIKFISAIFLFSVFVSCKKEEIIETPQAAILETLMPMPYMAKYRSLESKAKMVDVRTMSEYNAGHRKEAILIDVNMADFDQKAKEQLDLNKPVFVYCLSGARSQNAANRLQKLGFTVLYNLSGGYPDIKNL